MKVVFSGIQPTGSLHLGNYLGSICGFRELVNQNLGTYIFSIVDLHSITVFQDVTSLRHSILQTFATFLACGLDPSKNPNIFIFQQSLVPQHTQLAWILGCNTPLGWLDRMTQYKDKTSDNKERACLGLYSYPVLMAADILLYQTDVVPVGEDQVQHLELTRDIAMRINRLYGADVLKIPEYHLTEAKRIMSLKNASKKMSKSDENDNSRINLTDDPDLIRAKIKKATTGDLDSAEVKNLANIYRYLTSEEPNLSSYATFKDRLTDCLIAELEPIRQLTNHYLNDKAYLNSLLVDFSAKVGEIAGNNFKKISQYIL